MVSNNIVLVVDAESTNSGSGAVKVRGARKPTLNGKYSKMMTMAYQLCQHLREQNVIVDDAGFESSLAAVQMWGSIEEQSAFYERLIGASGESGKSMRRVIALHHKPVKQSKPRAKKEVGEKKVREKKAERPSTPVLVESDTEVVAEPVAAAKKAAKPRAPKKVAAAAVVTEAAASDASVTVAVDASATVESTKPAKAKKSKATVVSNKTAAAVEAASEAVVLPATVESAVPAPVPAPVPLPVPVKDTKARGRKKQEISIVHNDEENTIAQMVAAANRTDDYVEASAPVPESTTAPVPVPEQKKETKPRKPAVKKTVVDAAAVVSAEPIVESTPVSVPVPEPKKETKPRKPAVKKTAPPAETVIEAAPVVSAELESEPIVEPTVSGPVPVPVPVPESSVTNNNEDEAADDEDDDDEDEVHARQVMFNGQKYLVDQNNKVYDPESFDHIGTYSATDGTIALF